MMPMNFSDNVFLNIHGADYCCIIGGITKSEAINEMQNVNLSEKKVNHYKL